MGLISHRIERKDISAGDHIYTWRAIFAYSHHVQYTTAPSQLPSLGSSNQPASNSMWPNDLMELLITDFPNQSSDLRIRKSELKLINDAFENEMSHHLDGDFLCHQGNFIHDPDKSLDKHMDWKMLELMKRTTFLNYQGDVTPSWMVISSAIKDKIEQ
ncbi:hypothetical protein LguiB_006669 [Lonicera macranthoides]